MTESDFADLAALFASDPEEFETHRAKIVKSIMDKSTSEQQEMSSIIQHEINSVINGSNNADEVQKKLQAMLLANLKFLKEAAQYLSDDVDNLNNLLSEDFQPRLHGVEK